MISKRDSKPFKIKFPIGISKTNKLDTKYQDNWEDVYGLVGDPNGYIAKNIFGSEPNIDKTIIVNAGSLTRLINNDTCVLLDNMPTGIYENGDYSIIKRMPEYNGEIVLGLQKKQSIDIPKLYFFLDDTLLYFQLNYDKHKKVAYIGVNDIIPISIGDYVWDREPADSSSVKHKLKFVNKEKVGLSKNHLSFYKLEFEVVGE
jgi:hypothetical protein